VSRDIEPRQNDVERPSPARGSRSGSHPRPIDDIRDVFTRDLDLPRGTERERVWSRTKAHDLSRDDVRTLATVGAFRVVPANQLKDVAGDARHLRDSGLVRTMPYVVGRARTELVALTDEGRALLEDARRSTREPSQVFYAGIVKPKELAHDSRLYEAYLPSAEHLTARGGRVRRIALDYELKRDYQRFLQEHNRDRRDSSGKSTRDAEEVARWAREHDLTVIDGHVQFPDVRIEYDDRNGRPAVEDVEVTTLHYRGGQMAAKAQAGFSCYRAAGARLGAAARGSRGGGRPFDPRVAEDILE
jgi:hypothetical protein